MFVQFKLTSADVVKETETFIRVNYVRNQPKDPIVFVLIICKRREQLRPPLVLTSEVLVWK